MVLGQERRKSSLISGLEASKECYECKVSIGRFDRHMERNNCQQREAISRCCLMSPMSWRGLTRTVKEPRHISRRVRVPECSSVNIRGCVDRTLML